MSNGTATTISHERKFLIFKLQGSTYALDLNQVAEVGDPPELSPIPLAPACYSGALSFHGDIVAVINLAQFFGLSQDIPAGKIIILHQGTASLAFLVDSVVRIATENEIAFRASPVTDFTSATLSMPDGEAALLNLAALVTATEIALLKKR